jgi:VWFA-related protein
MTLRGSRALCTTAAFSLVLALPLGARQQTPPRQAGTLTEAVTAVLVDVVVRDRRGQPVLDLSQADFEVLEDGVPQAIGSFAPVFERPGVRAAAPSTVAPDAGAAAPPVNAGPLVIALVFDRLSPEGRRLAVKAAQSYLGTQAQTPSYIGIFGVDQALTPFAPFTRNARVLRDALQKMEARGSSSFNSPEQRQKKADADRIATSAAQAAAGAVSGAAGGGGTVGTAAGDAMLAQIESRMIAEFDVLERDQQGYSTTNGLFSIVNTLRTLPGRKSIVLFSEGIAIPPAVQRLFIGVIDAANRANVSIYTMDAAGLRAESEQAKIGVQVNEAAGGGGGILSGGESGGSPLSKVLENNEAVLRQDPRTGLGTLANDTGGLLFDSTNDLRPAFERIDTDLRNYYLLGYTPANAAYDGRFRTIEVKVKRPGVTVAARKGYFAVRSAGTGSINPWEAPALAALDRKPVPNAFPIRAAALVFPEQDRPGLVPVVVDLRTAPLTFQPSPDAKTYTSDFTVLVRFLDGHNQVVRKLSQRYELNGPLTEIERARRGEVIFYREAELPPGVYTMETIVHDALADKSSVRLSTVEVPAENRAGLRMSSLVLVKRTEKTAETDRRPGNPFVVKDIIVSPNLGEPVSKAAKELAFYVAVYPARGGPPPVSALELLQDGAVVARLAVDLAAPDASGRIQQVGRLPLERIPPALYELRLVVTQGAAQIARTTLVRITD